MKCATFQYPPQVADTNITRMNIPISRTLHFSKANVTTSF